MANIPAKAMARWESPADSGSTMPPMRATSEESGPNTSIRLGPNRA